MRGESTKVLQDQTTDEQVKKDNVTPNGKSISIVRANNSSHLVIQFDTGGELPEDLSGIFTSHTVAQKAIDKYLSKKAK